MNNIVILFHFRVNMLGVLFISNPNKKCKWIKAFLQHIKSYRKTGVRLREAQLLSPNGDIMVKDGEEMLTENDVMVGVYGCHMAARDNICIISCAGYYNDIIYVSYRVLVTIMIIYVSYHVLVTIMIIYVSYHVLVTMI